MPPPPPLPTREGIEDPVAGETLARTAAHLHMHVHPLTCTSSDACHCTRTILTSPSSGLVPAVEATHAASLPRGWSPKRSRR